MGSQKSFVQGGINYYGSGHGDSVFPLSLGEENSTLNFLPPDSEIIFSCSWQSVTGAWQRALKGWWHFPAAQQGPRTIQPLCKGDRILCCFSFPPLGSGSATEQVRSLLHLISFTSSPPLLSLVWLLELCKDQIIQQQTAQYETSSFLWPIRGPIINISVGKWWISFKENTRADFGNITCFLLNFEFHVDSCLGGFFTHKFKVMIVLQCSYNNSAYKVSVSASLGAQCRRQCLLKACFASKQLWCLFCVIWRACCPCSIQGFHTSLTHFSLPGFLLTGHKLSGGRGGLRSEKKDQSGPYFIFFIFIFFLI